LISAFSRGSRYNRRFEVIRQTYHQMDGTDIWQAPDAALPHIGRNPRKCGPDFFQ
jgi:hypothetical protein